VWTVAAHAHNREPSSTLANPLLIAMAITATFTVVELIGGFLSGSLALMSDAGHMFTDTVALALSLVAIRIAYRPPTEEQTYGFLRAEILAALANGAVLIVITILILYEAVLRIIKPPTIEAPLMLAVAIAGLAANAVGAFVLHDKSRTSLNIRGAFLHMMSDLLSSVAVIVAALLILFFKLRLADPVLSILIGAIILWGAWKLVTQSTHILLESVPASIRLEDVRESIKTLVGVVEVHDLHVWTLSSGLYALSAHIVVEDRLLSACSTVVAACEEMLARKFSISHTTFQLECETCGENACVFQPSYGRVEDQQINRSSK
jgi:cobalt-zinc-cadmium efflux system protein